MSDDIACPFCGNIINKNAFRCEQCGALFREPFLPGLKFTELVPFMAIDLLTLGFFSTIWFFINGKAVNKLVFGVKDGLKLKWLVALLAVNGGFYLFYFYQHAAFLILFTVLQCLIYIALTYRVLRIIQKYTQNTYEVSVNINPYYIILFNVFYLVHFIDTYSKRVQGIHAHFAWKSPQGIILIILLLIIIFLIRFYNEMYLLLY